MQTASSRFVYHTSCSGFVYSNILFSICLIETPCSLSFSVETWPSALLLRPSAISLPVELLIYQLVTLLATHLYTSVKLEL